MKVASSQYRVIIADNDDRNQKVATFLTDNRIKQGQFPGIVFVTEIEHAEAQARALSDALHMSIPAITGKMSNGVRNEYAQRLRAKDLTLPVVVATAAWSVGIDIPNLSWVCLAGRGHAPIRVLQDAGRALRKGDDKPAYEIINVFDARTPHQSDSEKRELHLRQAGYNCDAQFFEELVDRHQQDDPIASPTNANIDTSIQQRQPTAWELCTIPNLLSGMPWWLLPLLLFFMIVGIISEHC